MVSHLSALGISQRLQRVCKHATGLLHQRVVFVILHESAGNCIDAGFLCDYGLNNRYVAEGSQCSA